MRKFTLCEKTLHFKIPARTSRGEYTTHRMIIVTCLDENDDIIGVGECAPLPDLSCDRNEYQTLGDVDKIISGLKGFDDLRPYPALTFALESSYVRLPSNSFSRGEWGIPINGLVWISDYQNMLRQAQDKIEQGFKCIKLKIGALDWDEEMRLISTIRSRYSIQIRVDANGAFTQWDVDEKLKDLSKYSIHSIEQPVRQGQWDLMARLCRVSPVPIALDEELIGINFPDEKEKLLDYIKPQYIVIKPTLHGGFTGTREWVVLAGIRNISSWITSALESNIGLKSIANLSSNLYGECSMPQGLGTGLLYTDNIDTGLTIENGRLWMK